jgi:hypothetical protein
VASTPKHLGTYIATSAEGENSCLHPKEQKVLSLPDQLSSFEVPEFSTVNTTCKERGGKVNHVHFAEAHKPTFLFQPCKSHVVNVTGNLSLQSGNEMSFS